MNYNRIKQEIELGGRKQKWLAEQMEMSYQIINSWCNNGAQPSIENLYRIADILGVEAKDLLIDKKDVEKIK
jgi:putative transcriptional regulator